MLGFSLQKIAVLFGILAALWTLFRVVRAAARMRQRVKPGRKDSRVVATDMKPCPACGTFVAAAQARDCGRARCPYARAAGTASRA